VWLIKLTVYNTITCVFVFLLQPDDDKKPEVSEDLGNGYSDRPPAPPPPPPSNGKTYFCFHHYNYHIIRFKHVKKSIGRWGGRGGGGGRCLDK